MLLQAINRKTMSGANQCVKVVYMNVSLSGRDKRKWLRWVCL